MLKFTCERLDPSSLSYRSWWGAPQQLDKPIKNIAIMVLRKHHRPWQTRWYWYPSIFITYHEGQFGHTSICLRSIRYHDRDPHIIRVNICDSRKSGLNPLQSEKRWSIFTNRLQVCSNLQYLYTTWAESKRVHKRYVVACKSDVPCKQLLIMKINNIFQCLEKEHIISNGC